ncbi:MAG TPA: hypothetical protein VKV17_01380 [Bryobacteraceae bacterium]|nr:hypothetical protein [Bryobacteraceae bacterium]
MLRADSGFFDDKLLSFLEQRRLPYIGVARLTPWVKRAAQRVEQWTVLDDDYAVGEFRIQLHGWSTQRRFVVIREQIRDLLAEFQRAAGLPSYREPATIRTQVLTCGAILGRAGRRLVIHLSESWGGLKTRIPLLDSILHWEIPTSPKLEPALQT